MIFGISPFFLKLFLLRNIPINKETNQQTNRSTHLFVRRQWKRHLCLSKEINNLLPFIYCIYVVYDATVLLGRSFLI